MLQWHERVMLQWKLENGLWNDAQIFNFFESPGKRRLRLGIACLLILVGLWGFVGQLDDVAAYEQACREPIAVEAVIDVVEYNSGSYEEYVSYTCEGVRYERVFLRHRKSHLALDDDGERITVTLDPRDHGTLTRHMIREERWHISLGMMALGLAMLVYCGLLGNERLRSWLVSHGSIEGRELDQPDYPVDMAVLTILCYLVMAMGLWGLFPLAVGFAPTLAAGLTLVTGAVFRGLSMAVERNYKGR